MHGTCTPSFPRTDAARSSSIRRGVVFPETCFCTLGSRVFSILNVSFVLAYKIKNGTAISRKGCPNCITEGIAALPGPCPHDASGSAGKFRHSVLLYSGVCDRS